MTLFPPKLSYLSAVGRRAPAFGVALSLFANGCASRGNVELLEAQLRDQERLIQTYQTELSSARGELSRVQREVDILRSDLARATGTGPPQELTQALAAATSLAIHPLLTGGQNRDGIDGDDVVHAVIYPVDDDGAQVKLAGELTVEAIELADETRRLAKRSFSSEQSRELWHSGFLGSGFQVDLPLEELPADKDVLLRATLRTPDGRVLDATRTIAVAVAGESRIVPAPGESMPANDLPPPGPPPVPGITRATRASGDWTAETGDGSPSPRSGSGVEPAGLKTSDNWTDATIPWWR